MKKITTIDENNSYDTCYSQYCAHREIDKVNSCPICGVKIFPDMICAINGENYMYMQLECPECKEIFTMKYKIIKSFHIGYDSYTYELESIYPKQPKVKKIYSKIYEISKEFVEIYHQAEFAEAHRLDKIVGIGYRKSLEFLVKDYLKYKNFEGKNEIERKPLGQCINCIHNDNIKRMAKGATWLGNDETHYKRKWENKDINDLKNLIDLTLAWMELELKTEEYTKNMEL